MTSQTEEILRFRQWIDIHKAQKNKIRNAAALFAQSAMVRRMLECDFESGLNLYSAGELLPMLGFAGFGPFAELILNTAYGRAIVENDLEIINEISTYKLIEDQQQWFHRLNACDHETAIKIFAKEIDNPEERAMTRLILGRKYHDLITESWLNEVPEEFPQIAYAICQLMLHVEQDFTASVHRCLQGRPDIFLFYEPDPLFAQLVLRSTATPQQVLLPFEGFYGEQTVIAAAQWHIEHDQAQAALKLCKTMRPLSSFADQAYLIGGIACLELKNPQGAIDACAQIMNPAIADNLTLSIAQHAPDKISNSFITEHALACTSQQGDLFYGFLTLLLQRKDIESARKICFTHQETFLDHPTLKKIMDVVIKGNKSTASAPS